MEQWFIKNKKADFKAIAGQLHISEVMARLIVNRNITGPEELKHYVEADITGLHSPRLMKDMDKAAAILMDKIREKKRIRIIGDYDVDGVMSVCILSTALNRLGALADYEIPDRVRDGYGINMDIVKAAGKDGIDTLLTCDNGIAAMEQVRYAKECGMTVIITDHHDLAYEDEGGERVYRVPEADAVVNPKQEDCSYPCKQICGAAVAFKLVQLLYEAVSPGGGEADELLEYAAIATICDVMDLVDENRILVKHGLAAVRNTSHIGLRALLKATGLEGKELRTDHIGFILGPCINASGRLESAKLGLEMLLASDAGEAEQAALRLTELNNERKSMTSRGLEEAVGIIEETAIHQDKVLVVYLPDCHESLAGIIAGRIRERYDKPAIVLTKGEREIKGSGRSIEADPMFDRLNECRDLLIRFGGHPMAAGLSLLEENIDLLRLKLNERPGLSDQDLFKKVTFDMVLPFDMATEELIGEFSMLEPFGKGNPKPLFALKHVILVRGSVLGSGKNVIRLSMKAGQDNRIYQGILFQKAEIFERFLTEKYGSRAVEDLYTGKACDLSVDIIFCPEINEYKQYKNVQMVIEHYR